jgi:hypothetical protein
VIPADCGGTVHCGGRCQTCATYLDVAGRDDPGFVVAETPRGGRSLFWFNDAEPYRPGAPSFILGYGGAKWIIRFHGGRVVHTNDLYGSGQVPARFLGMFPVSAILSCACEYDDCWEEVPWSGKPLCEPHKLARAVQQSARRRLLAGTES